MAAISPGKRAPEFTLPALAGGSVALQEALRRGPVVAAFFKVSCPTCQYTFPFLERLFRAYPGGKVTLVGIVQDPPEHAREFARQYGITFPVLLDDTSSYPVSNAYGLTYVPTVFYISPQGVVELTSEGWFRPEFEDLNARVAAAAGSPPAAIFASGEDVLHSKAG